MFIRVGLPARAEAKVLVHIHPSSVWFALPLRPVPTHALLPVRCPGDVLATRDRRVPRAPLPVRGVTRAQDNLQGSSQRTLPLLHRSYGLMRQTKSLPLTPVSLASGSLQVVTSPCWAMVLPDVISASLSLDAWTRTPSARGSAPTRYFPPQHRPSPLGTEVGAEKPRSATSERPRNFGAAVIH